MTEYPTSGPWRVARLVGSLVAGRLRGRDRREALHAWIRAEAGRHGGDGFVIDLVVKKLLVVTGPELSAKVLGASPELDGIAAGDLKRRGMAYLAPRALTISHGEEWRRRRAFNEEVLALGRSDELPPAILTAVRSEFGRPVRSAADVRERMARVMVAVDFGGGTPALASDLAALMKLVRNPLRRAVLGRWYAGRRRAFYRSLAAAWERAGGDSLVGRARAAGAEPSPESLEQVPHWMFTFTGSAADLVVRTVALVGSRPRVAHRARRELEAAAPAETPDAVASLEWLDACVREAGRLYPPVTRTFHTAPVGAQFDGQELPAGIEIIHYLPYLARDRAADSRADTFYPERWLGPDRDESQRRYPYLFLGGARRCAGEDLAMLVVKGAVAALLSAGPLEVAAASLSHDPVPVTFPPRDLRFALAP